MKTGITFLTSSFEPNDVYYTQEINALYSTYFFAKMGSYSQTQIQRSFAFKILDRASKIKWEYIDKKTVWNVANYNLQPLHPLMDDVSNILDTGKLAIRSTMIQGIISTIYFSMLLKLYFTKEIMCSDFLHYYHMNTNELIELYQFYYETQLFDKLMEQNLLRMIDIDIHWLDLWLEQAIEFKDHSIVAKLMDYKNKEFGCSHEIELL